MLRSLAFVLLLSLAVAADEVELTDGTKIEGKVEDLGDSIKITRSTGSVTYPKHLVKRIEYKKTKEEEYVEKSNALKKDDIEGRLKLAEWCEKHKLAKEAKSEYGKIIEVDPDNEKARAALGYKLYKDKWLTEDEIKTAEGFVKHKGKWMTPEERDLDLALEAQKELDKEIVREVTKWLDKMGPAKEETRKEAREHLEKIDDKHKVKPYLAAITSSYKPIRLFVAEELGRMKEKSAAKPLARRAIWDTEETIRAAALKALRAINHPDTVTFLIPYLEEESSVARMRVEDALAEFKDLRSVPPLISLLQNVIETLNFMEKYKEQMAQMLRRELLLKNGQRVILPANLKIGPDMWDAESKRRLTDEKSTIQTALRSITGQDLGEEPAKWKAWYDKNKK